jgi:hypothetical protein
MEVMMKKYEYKVFPVKKGAFTSEEKFVKQFSTELNTLGIEGWELIEITGSAFLDGYVIQVFKRELDQC